MTRVSHPQKATRRRWFGLSRNNRGSVLLLVMIAAPVAAALFFSLIEMVLISKKQTIINRNMVSYSAMMDGVIDYTNYAIKNRWCMSSTWVRDQNACDFSHPRNFERMTLDVSAITALRDLNKDNSAFSASTAVLDSISTVINVDDLVSTHPLYYIGKNLANIGRAVTQIGITVTRVNNIDVPRRGREAYLDIKVTLMSGSVIFRNLSAISATSRVMITPREMNYFSLVVPKDLYLDGTMSAQNGDFSVPAGTGGTGLSFESPVFVNGDIYIPRTGAAYTSATFSNRVILGGPNSSGAGGRIMQNGSPFSAPNSGNMSSYLYSVMDGFGGFKKGIDIDGSRDSGLDVLAGYGAAAPTATSDNAVKCININKKYFSLQATNTSNMVFKPIPYDPVNYPNMYRFYVGLTEGNLFTPQEAKPQFVNGPYTGRAKLIDDSGTGMVSNIRLGGDSTMFIRIDEGPTGGLGTPTTGAPTTTQNTVKVSLRPRSTVQLTNPWNMMASDGITVVKTFKGHILVSLVPVIRSATGEFERDVVEVRVSVDGALYPTTIQDFSVYMKAYDLGTFGGRDRRTTGNSDPNTSTLIAPNSLEGWLHFRVSGGTAPTAGSAGSGSNGTLKWLDLGGNETDPTVIHPYSTYTKMDPPLFAAPWANSPIPGSVNLYDTGIQLPDENLAYQTSVEECLGGGGSNSSAFAAIGWNSPFVASTRYSWHFSPVTANPTDSPEPNSDYTTIPAGGLPLTINNGTFYVNSIVGTCTIPGTTTVASGFLTCDNLVITARTTPLLMIGTFIVNKVNIDSSAVRSGITFRSIYHPQSQSTLLSVGAMSNIDGTACVNPPAYPIWWPTLSGSDYDSFRKCNVVSLRDKANPFTWTSVNPDCGVVSGSNYTQCQKHVLNYILNEISRTSELQ